MKKKQVIKKFLEHLANIPIVSSACEKTGISRQTFYRWRVEDYDFRKDADVALSLGKDAISDLAESKIASKINTGDLRASMYWLDNNRKPYNRLKMKNTDDYLDDENQIEGITLRIEREQADGTFVADDDLPTLSE
jgi:hypothetical protein